MHVHDVKVSTISRFSLHFRIYTFNGKHEDPSKYIKFYNYSNESSFSVMIKCKSPY